MRFHIANLSCTLILGAAKGFSLRLPSRDFRGSGWLWKRHGNWISVEIRSSRSELEGWSNVTVRRLSDEISYSQPVLYAHFGSREGILAAVAIEGFQGLGLALEKARKLDKRGNTVESVGA